MVGRDTLSPLSPPLGPQQQKQAHIPPAASAAHCGQYVSKYVTSVYSCCMQLSFMVNVIRVCLLEPACSWYQVADTRQCPSYCTTGVGGGRHLRTISCASYHGRKAIAFLNYSSSTDCCTRYGSIKFSPGKERFDIRAKLESLIKFHSPTYNTYLSDTWYLLGIVMPTSQIFNQVTVDPQFITQT